MIRVYRRISRRARAAALFMLQIAACTTAPGPVHPPVRVALDDSLDGLSAFNADQRRVLLEQLVVLAALGPEFRHVSPGEADVVVRPARLDAGGACGRYVLGSSTVEVDSACTQGFDGLRKAASHELMHYLLVSRFGWRGHLCRWAINETPPPGCHPTIQCPAAGCLLEPGLRPTISSGVDDYAASFADAAVTESDRELVRVCAARGRCE